VAPKLTSVKFEDSLFLRNKRGDTNQFRLGILALVLGKEKVMDRVRSTNIPTKNSLTRETSKSHGRTELAPSHSTCSLFRRSAGCSLEPRRHLIEGVWLSSGPQQGRDRTWQMAWRISTHCGQPMMPSATEQRPRGYLPRTSRMTVSDISVETRRRTRVVMGETRRKWQ
jgi:hypothetical protein